jgi:hypothetical protein
MIKGPKQLLGFGDYQGRNLQAIQRHIALSLLNYTPANSFEDPPVVKKQNGFLGCPHSAFGLPSPKTYFLKHTTIILNRIKIEFNQSFLDTYFEKFWA